MSPAIRTLDPQRENPVQNDPQLENIAPNDPQTAIFTHDESDTDFPTQNETTDENPTQNDEISTETRTEQQISDSETTCANYTQETQLLPGTQPNLTISPPNSPETGFSHTEHHLTRLQQQNLHLDLYNAFPRQFPTF
jgi:type IV secretory pathway ATPase VirB11/archaellum biosynthesis ATPase